MDAEAKEELEALVSAFLTQSLKENPNGVTLNYFERFFPEKSDEADNWYERFKKKNTLEALRAIPNLVRLSPGGLISLNFNSNKIDRHLVDLITNQKSSGKRKKSMGVRSHSQRVLDSFTLNRRYSGSFNTENRFRSRIQPGQGNNRYSNSSSRQDPYRYSRQTSYNDQPAKPTPGDPRARPATHMVPPQVRPAPAPSSNATPSKQSTMSVSANLPTYSTSPKVHSSSSHQQASTHIQKSSAEEPKRVLEDPTLDHKRSFLRQRLLQMLAKRYPEINIFYLTHLYKAEYEEEFDPELYGFKSISALLKDQYFSDYIRINYKSPMNTISLRSIGAINGKENVTSLGGNQAGATNESANGVDPLADKSNLVSATKKKFNAIDPFNVDKMLQSLEPLKAVKESPLGNSRVEDTIKYRTMRIIFKDPKLTLKLDDWERRYQQEWNCHNKIQIREYGFKTLLEFFKHLSAELPIKIRLNDRDEWIATGDFGTLSDWMKSKMAEGSYRAITVVDSKYDQVAFPTDTYPLANLNNLPKQDYYPAIIMSVSATQKMWIQLRTQKRIEEHLSIETSLSCYEDYKRKGFFEVPQEFIKVGFPCVAFDESQHRWCRAVVIKPPDSAEKDSQITAFLVDYAITKNFVSSQLLCILKNHLKHPVGLIYCQLHGLEAKQKRLVKVTLQEYTNPPVTLACKIVASSTTDEDDVDIIWQSRKTFYNVTLIDTRQGRDCNLATAINTCTSTPED